MDIARLLDVKESLDALIAQQKASDKANADVLAATSERDGRFIHQTRARATSAHARLQEKSARRDELLKLFRDSLKRNGF